MSLWEMGNARVDGLELHHVSEYSSTPNLQSNIGQIDFFKVEVFFLHIKIIVNVIFIALKCRFK
jgi:hypothetical protein